MSNKLERGRDIMVQQIKSVMRNSGTALLQDAVGGLAIVVMLVLALHVPGFV